MYLLTASQINSCMSNQQASGQVVGLDDISRYAHLLGLIKTRCEEVLEVASLTQGVTLDYFEIGGRLTTTHCLRLSSAFLSTDPTQFLLTDDREQVLDLSPVVDREKGLVWVTLPPGRYRVTYTSGFAVDGNQVFLGTPDWLQSIAIYTLTVHLRTTTMADKTPLNVRFIDLMSSTRREMYTRITHRWQRPRIDITVPLMSVRNGQ